MRDRLGVRGRLLLAFLGISAFVVLAASAAIYSFTEVGKALDRITRDRVPSALASLEISRQAERIVAVAPALLAVTTSAQHEQVFKTITAEVEHLNDLLNELKGSGISAATLGSIETTVAQVNTNLTALDALVASHLKAGERMKELLQQLSSTHIATRRLLAPGLLVMEAELSQLGRILDDPDLTGEQRTEIMTRLVRSIASSPPLQRAQLEALTINDTLIQAASAPQSDDLSILTFPLRRSLGALESVATGLGPMLRPRLMARVTEFVSFVDGPDSILRVRENELGLIAGEERLLSENAELSRLLTEAVDRLVGGAEGDIRNANLEALSVQQFSTKVLAAIVALSLVSSTLIVWLYVGRNLIGRVTALSDSMLAIASGNLEAVIPARGADEIGDMAEALAVFRDTAIEVRETNLREIREARRRLVDAIESISEAFSLYDNDDRLVVCNSKYRTLLYPGIAEEIVPGITFEAIIRRAAERGYIKDARDRVEEWLAGRLARHRDPGEPHVQQRGDGRWVRVSERKTEDGGTVAVYTDITELKRVENALREKSEFLQLNQVITRAANEAVSVKTVMQMALDQVCAQTGWPVGHLYTLDESTGGLAPGGIWHIDDTDKFATFRRVTEATRFAKGVGLPGRVLASGNPAWIEDVTKDPNFPRAQLATDLGVKGAFAFPVLIGHEITAVLEFFSEDTAEPYEPLLEVMAQIGTQLGRVIERKRAAERARAELLRIEEELQSARELQSAMLPRQFSPPTSQRPVECTAMMQPAREVGGDFYDVIELDEKCLGIVIADVAGKGAGAALFMARAFTILDATARRGGRPGEVLSNLNDLLCVNNDNVMFVTVFYGVFDGSTGRLTFANAGHNPPLLIRSDRRVEPLQLTGGVAVGVKPNLDYQELSIEIRPGDTVFCYTDGFTEAKNSSNEEFSVTNLEKVLADCAQIPVENIPGRVIEGVNEFTEHASPFDDMSCVVMRRIGDRHA